MNVSQEEKAGFVPVTTAFNSVAMLLFHVVAIGIPYLIFFPIKCSITKWNLAIMN